MKRIYRFCTQHKLLTLFLAATAVFMLGLAIGADPAAAMGAFALPMLAATAGQQVGPDDSGSSGTTLWKSDSYGSFFGATPVVQPSGSAQAALPTGADYECWAFRFNNTEFADGDMITNWTPGFAGTLVKLQSIACTPATTGGKASTLNLEIGTTNVTAGTLPMTSTTLGTKGLVTDGAAITGASTFGSTDTISLEAASTTAFIEGTCTILIWYKRTAMPGLVTAMRTALVNLGLMAGS